MEMEIPLCLYMACLLNKWECLLLCYFAREWLQYKEVNGCLDKEISLSQ